MRELTGMQTEVTASELGLLATIGWGRARLELRGLPLIGIALGQPHPDRDVPAHLSEFVRGA